MTIKAKSISRTEDRELIPADWKQLIIYPITRHPCEGDLAYLCPEYGCARKSGFRRDQRKIPELARELTDRGSPVDQTVYVCFWYKADIVECSTNVRFRSEKSAYDPERT
jgi:hypothetical protein